MWTRTQQYRLALEKKLLTRELPQCLLWAWADGARVIGWHVPTGAGTPYQLQLELPPWYPDQEPQLMIASPLLLSKHGGVGTVNDEGLSHSFHTHGNGPAGQVQICHNKEGWDASQTCVSVLYKGICWLQAYWAYFTTGRPLRDFLC